MIIAVTGSSGLVGSALVRALEGQGHEVRRLVRRDVRDAAREIHWDPVAGEIDAARLDGVDAIVNLAGENLAAHRWTDQFKRQIRDSRIVGTRLLSETLTQLERPPAVLCSASATGYYGDRGDEPIDESAAPGRGFLAEVCQQWEAATDPARDAGIRVVKLRIGVVLSARGGALAKMLPPFRKGLGGVIGTGRQLISWIALNDLISVIEFVLTNSAPAGPVNAVAPESVTNREFTKTLGRVLGRPTVMPIPAFAARLAFGEMADALILGGARVVPTALREAGFSFAYPQLEPALRHMLLS